MKSSLSRCKRSISLVLLLCTGISVAQERETSADRSASTMPATRADASARDLASDLALRLYRPALMPSAEHFGQCLGGYIAPVTPPAANAKTDNAGERLITAELDRLTGQRDGQVALQGNVLIRDGQRLLQADSALLEQADQKIRFPQGLLVTEPNLIVQGQRAEIGLQGETLQLGGVQWLLLEQQLRGSAASLVQGESGQVVLKDAELTRCSPGNQGWSLGADRLEINQGEGFAQANGAVLKVRSIPVAYLPRMRVSMDGSRTTGWQMPTGGLSSQDGLEAQFPYYWQLDDALSATLAPRWVSRRGVGIDGQLSYAKQSNVAEANVSFLPSDDLYNGYFDRDIYKALGGDRVAGPFEPADRWLFALQQRGEIGSLSTRVDFARSSDRDFFRDLDSYVGLTNPNALQQFAEVAYVTDHLDLSLYAVGFQRLDELNISDYKVSPALQLNYRSNPMGRGFGWAVQAQVAEFDQRQGRLSGLANASPGVEGRRTHLQPSIGYRRDGKGGYWSLQGGYKFTQYDLDQLVGTSPSGDLANTAPDRGVGFFSLDTGLIFERDLKWADRQWTQTLEPRVFYLYQEYEDQDDLPGFDTIPRSLAFDALFADNRYVGLDRIGDADRLTLAATTRLLQNSGRERAALSLGYLQHLSNPRVQLFGQADIGTGDLIAAEQTVEVSPNIQLRGWQLWHRDRGEWEEVRASLHLRGLGRRVYNMGFNQRDVLNIKQAELSTYAPLSQHLAVTGRWHYDLASQRTLEAFVGVEYDDCCIKLRLIARQYLENPSYRDFGLPQALLPVNELRTDRGVLLEVELKGLAGIGSKVETLLRRSIYGYGAPMGSR